ncbi:MAG: SDR family NAD(P)-dependent oxidoreductase [Pseudomonadota bacterium]
MPKWLSAGRTAVVTGGASGIGLAAAERFLANGMRVVLADRDAAALASAKVELTKTGASSSDILVQTCDVSNAQDLEELRVAAVDRFGTVHCLMNNAGIANRGAQPWEDVDAMKALVEVNLWGIVNGCAAFIPSMLKHGEPAAVINTGSKQGITRPPGNIAYNISKAGVLAYTESLAHAFRELEDCQLSAHLLVPGFVYSGMVSRFLPEKPPGAATPEETVDFMLGALGQGDFYILCPDNETTRTMDEKRILWAAEDMIQNRPALSRWHPDYAGAFNDFMVD